VVRLYAGWQPFRRRVKLQLGGQPTQCLQDGGHRQAAPVLLRDCFDLSCVNVEPYEVLLAAPRDPLWDEEVIRRNPIRPDDRQAQVQRRSLARGRPPRPPLGAAVEQWLDPVGLSVDVVEKPVVHTIAAPQLEAQPAPIDFLQPVLLLHVCTVASACRL
jgi:hypothetical protein